MERKTRQRSQPYLLCLGSQDNPGQYFAILDNEAIPCDTDITSAVDRILKLHYVFNLEYPPVLYGFYVFLELCVFGIEVTAKVPSCVRELDNSLAILE